MGEKRSGPGDIPTTERMRDIGAAMASSAGKKMTGDRDREQVGASLRLNEEHTHELISNWPSPPKLAAEQLIKQYGPANEGTPARLIWYNCGPWKRVEVTATASVRFPPKADISFAI